MKYDSQITELKNLLPAAKNILICLPANADIDKLAAGLGLFLILEASGKQVSIVSDDAIKVSQSHLFGVDHIQNSIPQTEGGNLTVTLEGVAASDNTVPALEKLDWFAENNNLNLVFHVLPGQTFQPARIVPHYQGSGFNVIFAIGAANLNALGNVYQANSQVFSGTHIVNIDTQTANTSFGATNVLDTGTASVSEVMVNLIADLGLSMDADCASNLLAGIFEVTSNLTDPGVSAETYMAVASCLRVGGRKPGQQTVTPQPQTMQPQVTPPYDWSVFLPKDAMNAPKDQPQPQTQSVPDFMVPPVVSSNQQVQPPADAGDHETASQQAPQPASTALGQGGPSPEERPYEEGVISETVEPEWLTPKIFKGTSLG